MPRFRREKPRSRSLETAMLLWSMWRWLPAGQKRRALLLARRHGPWIVSTAFRRRRR
jgi:hypothetical protein